MRRAWASRALRGVGATVALLVGVANARAQEPSILNRARVDPSKPIDFHALVSPETLYVGQQATYQVAVYLDERARSLLRRNPEFLPPEMRGLLAYELGTPLSFPPRTVAGKQYAAHVFQKALFPLASGTLVVPAPKLSYSLPQSSSYFAREEQHVVEAESTSLVVKALPDIGRPVDFSGAVGVLKSVVRLDTSTARVGDPLVLTLRVQGTGNVKLLPRPTLEVSWASSVPSTERLQVDTSGTLVRGAKEFDWILTPSQEGAVSTPAIDYTYFNPYTKKYEVAEAVPVALTVQKGGLAAPEPGEVASTSSLPLRDHTVGSVPPAPTTHWLWWIAFAMLPVPALVLAVSGMPRVRPKAAAIESLRALGKRVTATGASSASKLVGTPAPTAAHTLASASPSLATSSHASDAPNASPTARDVRRLFLASLARRLDVKPDVLHERARTQRVLLRRGVTRETTRDLLAKLGELDVAAFASGNVASDANRAAAPTARRDDVSALTAQVLALYDRVDSEALAPAADRAAEKKRGKAKAIPKPVIFGVMLAMLAVHTAVLHAQSDSAWSHAVTAYRHHGYVDASEAFLRLSIAAPRDADALANWGIASWEAGDTVSAVMAWQRAVRLDPLAADLRENLMRLPPGARDGIAEIPMIPVAMFAYAGIVAWTLGWCTLAVLAWRRRTRRTTVATWGIVGAIAVVIGAAGVGVAAWGDHRLQSDGIAVVVRPETMRAGPEADADALGGSATGDVVRVVRTQQQWSRVQHADGREGWLPSDHLAPLADGSP